MTFCLSLFWSPAFSGFQEPFPAGGGADVWAGADNEVGEQCCTACLCSSLVDQVLHHPGVPALWDRLGHNEPG